MKVTHTFARIALIASAISLFAVSAVAQEKKVAAKDVPAAVITAFKNSYPNATIRGYDQEKEHGKVFYEIESREGTTERDVLYNPDGTVAEIEESIAATDLPAPAQAAIHKQYPKAVISLAEKTTAGDKVGYEFSAKQAYLTETVLSQFPRIPKDRPILRSNLSSSLVPSAFAAGDSTSFEAGSQV